MLYMSLEIARSQIIFGIKSSLLINTDGSSMVFDFFLNTDGVVHSVSGLSIVGGVIFIIQSDNLEVVAAISNRKLEGSNSTLVRQIRQILSVEERWCLRYVPRENNKIAYALVKMALSNVEGLDMIEDPPIEIQEVIKEDNARGNLQKNMNM
ncbi:hypothetical protein Goari_003132 [Gossypium aridum]|uniref:RNase H type-1 domain-containing protein n=1 Tax=Gossypium aridum TaxID=34290 RepID=A0A7J8YBA9_GOSAI|nr:hypothetical protein [Gossypium aridum]